MVISLFPKRRRRRRWHGVTDHELVDPPSFSDIQPEPTIRSESEVLTEVPVVRAAPKTPLCRPRRKSTIGTPAVRHEIPANQLQCESAKVSCELPGSAASTKRRTSGRLHADMRENIGEPSFRRSSRLLQSCSMNPVMPPSPISMVDSSRTPRRVSFSASEKTPSEQRRGKPSMTGRLSTLSAGEENSDYRAFIDRMIDLDLVKNSTECSRASMTDPYACSEGESVGEDEVQCVRETDEVQRVRETDEVQRVLETDEVQRVRETDEVQRVRETDSDRNQAESSIKKFEQRSQPSPREVPEKVIPPPIEAPVGRKELQIVKKSDKVKPQMKDARCSTTGLDEFVRSSRRKKSMCVQIDLDKTAAFGTTVFRDSAGENVSPDRSDRIVGAESQLPTQSSVDVPSGIHNASEELRRGSDCNENLCPDPPQNEKTQSYRERRPSELRSRGVQLKTRTENLNHGSSLGMDVRSRPKRKSRQDYRTPESERTKEASTARAKPRITETNRDHPAAVTDAERPADDLSRLQMESEVVQPEKSNGCSKGFNKDLGPAPGKRARVLPSDSSKFKPPPPRDLAGLMPASSAKSGEEASTPQIANPSGRETAGIPLRSFQSDPSSSRHQRPFPPTLGGSRDTSTKAKSTRTVRVKTVAARRSPEIDILGVAQRIKKEIERKKLIENTIYRRVNLIYEELWEDFLETYYPEKWRKLKDVWMVRKAQKRIEEEQRGLGELDEEMEREVELGTQLGAAKYIQEFEEKRAGEDKRKFVNGKSSGRTVERDLYPLEEENCRRSRRLRDLAPLQSFC